MKLAFAALCVCVALQTLNVIGVKHQARRALKAAKAWECASQKWEAVAMSNEATTIYCLHELKVCHTNLIKVIQHSK